MTPGCSHAAPIAPGTSADETIPTDPAIAGGETQRTYRVHLPAGYTPDRAVAVVLAFHGYGGTSAGMEELTGFSALADQEGFIAVYPQGVSDYEGHPFWASVGRGDYGVDDVRFVGNLLDALARDFCIDRTRIDATGFSNGGAMTGRLACRLDDRIAAFAPVSGNFYEPDEGCHPHRPVPILEIHGTADRVVSYYGVPEYVSPRWSRPSIPQWLRGWAARDACAPEPETFLSDGDATGIAWPGCARDGTVIHYRMEGGDHDWPVAIHGRTTAAIMWDFFQAHPLPTAPSPARAGEG
jgi:polyhydroxybutyrate depolymerase